RKDVGELLADRHGRKDGVPVEAPPALPVRNARHQVDHQAPSASNHEGNSMAALGVDVALNCLADAGQPIRVEAQVTRIFQAHDVLLAIRLRSTGTRAEASIDDPPYRLVERSLAEGVMR